MEATLAWVGRAIGGSNIKINILKFYYIYKIPENIKYRELSSTLFSLKFLQTVKNRMLFILYLRKMKPSLLLIFRAIVIYKLTKENFC